MIAEILHIPYEDLRHFTNNVSLSPQNSDAKKVLLAALVQGLGSNKFTNLNKFYSNLFLNSQKFVGFGQLKSYLKQRGYHCSRFRVTWVQTANEDWPQT